MKRITKEMLHIYKPLSGLDWMNYRIVRDTDITFHHILKRENGGDEVINNGAILVRWSHTYLHIIEYKDHDTYATLNKLFEIINKQGCEPTLEQREIIEYVLRKFEEEHKYDLTSKGEPLIKRKYKNRW